MVSIMPRISAITLLPFPFPTMPQIAFTSAANGKEQELLEPGLLPTLASMLQCNLPRAAMLRALKVLKLCTSMSGPQHLSSWNLVGLS